MNNWFDQLLVWDVALAPNEYMKFGTKDMLVESIFVLGEALIVADLSVVMAMM